MILPPPLSTLTDTLFPYTTRIRSTRGHHYGLGQAAHLPRGGGGGQLHPCRRTAEPQPVGGEPPDLGPRGQPEGAPLPPPCPRPHPHRAGRVAVPHGPRGVRQAGDDRGPAHREDRKSKRPNSR